MSTRVLVPPFRHVDEERVEMVQLTGMDIAQVRALARQMDAEARVITEMVKATNIKFAALPWAGRDRDAFIERWNNTHAVGLSSVADDLAESARSVRQYADQQERASRS